MSGPHPYSLDDIINNELAFIEQISSENIVGHIASTDLFVSIIRGMQSIRESIAKGQLDYGISEAIMSALPLNSTIYSISLRNEINPYELSNMQSLTRKGCVLHCIPIVVDGDISYLLLECSDQYTPEQKFQILQIYDLFDFYISYKLFSIKSNMASSIWEEAFNKLPFATAVLDDNYNLILCNKKMVGIGFPHEEYKTLRHCDSTVINGRTYYVIRRDIVRDDINFYIVVLKHEDDLKKMGQEYIMGTSIEEDLGIITASIAHELNNPLAGIMTTLELLGSNNDWNEEANSMLVNMKESTVRCKELIEILLGFSRFDITNRCDVNISGAFQKALLLLRFRMIESDINVDIATSNQPQVFCRSLNPSIMSMVFYLFMNEVLASASIYGRKCLTGTLEESNNTISIKLDDRFVIGDNLIKSPLILYLLGIEHLNLQVFDDAILLTESPMRFC